MSILRFLLCLKRSVANFQRIGIRVIGAVVLCPLLYSVMVFSDKLVLLISSRCYCRTEVRLVVRTRVFSWTVAIAVIPTPAPQGRAMQRGDFVFPQEQFCEESAVGNSQAGYLGWDILRIFAGR